MVKIKNIISALVFIFAISFIFFSALHSIDEPLERDLTTYGYIGHSLLQGERLYTDLWDHKPPGIHLAFALAELIWGYGQHSITFLWIVLMIITTMLIFLILERISGWQAGLMGVVTWVLAANSAYLQANQPNTEIFLNLFTLVAMLALVQDTVPRIGHLHLAGWAMGIATLFKPIAVFVLAALALYSVLPSKRSSEPWTFKTSVLRSLILGYPVAILWFIMLGYAFVLNRFEDYWDILFVYNSQYSGNSLLNIWSFFTHPTNLFPRALYGIWVLVIFAIAWLFVGSQSSRIKVPHSFFIFSAFGILFGIGSLGRVFPHYYQTLFPVVTIFSSLLLVYIYTEMNVERWWRRSLGVGISLLFLITAFDHQKSFFQLSSLELSQEKYGDQYIDAWEMGKEIAGLTDPSEKIYYWGSESGIYYYSQRQSASGIFYNLPVTDKRNKNSSQMMDRIINDLIATPPEVFIWNTREGNLENHPLADFVNGGYYLLGNRSQYQVYVKNIN